MLTEQVFGLFIVLQLLVPFTGNASGGGMHLAATFIGNDKIGFWTSGVGVFAPAELLRAIDYVAREDVK